MMAAHTPGSLKRFRRTPWRFQQTFQTPLAGLDRFVATIFSEAEEIESATVTIDKYAFEPTGLQSLVPQASPVLTLGPDVSLTAENREEVLELLKLSSGNWVDFLFVPQPKPFVIYADHDEFATFFAASKSNLNRATGKLIGAGFEEVEGYQREV